MEKVRCYCIVCDKKFGKISTNSESVLFCPKCGAHIEYRAVDEKTLICKIEQEPTKKDFAI